MLHRDLPGQPIDADDLGWPVPLNCSEHLEPILQTEAASLAIGGFAGTASVNRNLIPALSVDAVVTDDESRPPRDDASALECQGIDPCPIFGTPNAVDTEDDFIPRDSGLGASSTSSSQVQLSWTDNSNNENGFKIEQKSTGDWTQACTTPANTQIYYVGGLSSAYTYSFRVRAYNSDGNSDYSNEAARKPGEDITVYITNTGTKYHRDGCQYLASSKIAINLLDAKAQGYTPCSVCNPPTSHR